MPCSMRTEIQCATRQLAELLQQVFVMVSVIVCRCGCLADLLLGDLLFGIMPPMLLPAWPQIRPCHLILYDEYAPYGEVL